MAPQQGFACNTVARAGITTTYALARIITLDGSTDAQGIDANAKDLPSGGYWSEIEINVTQTAGTVATLTFHLTWDAAGDVKASSEATITLVPGITTATKKGGASGLDVWPQRNASGVAGKLYLWVKTDSGTCTVDTARAYWRDHQAG